MLFDPGSSTLYVDSHLANNLKLEDGTTVELPTDVLLNSIQKGQVQVVNKNDFFGNQRMDIGESKNNLDFIKAHVIKPQFAIKSSAHESIRDLLHLQAIKNKHQFVPNAKEENAKNNKVGKVWYQINEPSYNVKK